MSYECTFEAKTINNAKKKQVILSARVSAHVSSIEAPNAC